MEQLISACSIMLLFSIVAGAATAVIQGICLLALKTAPPIARYSVLCFLFFAFVAACGWMFLTTIVEMKEGGDSIPLVGNLQLTFVNTSIQGERGAGGMKLLAVFRQAEVFVFALWIIFFLLKALHFFWQWKQIRTATRQAWSPGHGDLSVLFDQLVQRVVPGKEVVLRITGQLKGAMVVGFWRPVVLLPVSFLNGGMPLEQVQVVLFHELAHVRRHDYLFNLLQSMVDTIFFFNPFYLWLSAVLRREREYCCDEFVVTAQGKKELYVNTLVGAYAAAVHKDPYAVGFASSGGAMVARVERVIDGRYPSIGYVPMIGGFIFLLVMLLTPFFQSLPLQSNKRIAGVINFSDSRRCTHPNHLHCNNLDQSQRPDAALQEELRKVEQVSEHPGIRAVLQQLLRHRIIFSVEGARFVLTKNELIVNGVVRIDCVYEELAGKYLGSQTLLSFNGG